MNKIILLGIMFLVVPVFVFATTIIDNAPQNGKEPKITKETQEEREERINNICEQLIEEGNPQEVAVGPHIKAGKIVKWFAENTNSADGWSLTGYSSLKVDKNLNKSRWKIGIINSELDYGTYNDIVNGEPYHHQLEEWNRRKTDRIFFGISFIKEF